ncbi:MAG: hypothetical protein IAF38_14220 [Bacteroidia bacterium]|nr:hypothetical protein [Bacteroidia bacterium]
MNLEEKKELLHDDAIMNGNNLSDNTVIEELKWLKRILEEKRIINSKENLVEKNIYDLVPPLLTRSNSPYAELLKKYNFNFDERLVLILSLSIHIYPKILDIFKMDKLKVSFGGVTGKNYRGFIPTGETIMFILAGSNLGKRFELIRLFEKDHVFYKENFVYLEEASAGEPEFSGILTPSRDLVDLVLRGQVRKPDLSPDFPAKLITTDMDWEDLVVPSYTTAQLQEIEQWIKYSEELLADKNNHARPALKI